MEIIVYTKPSCPYCTSAKSWLKQKGYDFKEVNLDTQEKKESFIKDHPTLRTMPQIFADGELIGGFQELSKSKLA